MRRRCVHAMRRCEIHVILEGSAMNAACGSVGKKCVPDMVSFGSVVPLYYLSEEKEWTHAAALIQCAQEREK